MIRIDSIWLATEPMDMRAGIGLSPRIACSGKIGPMTSPPNLDHLTPEQLPE